MAKETIADQIARLRKQAEELAATRKDELINEINERIEELKGLGYANYSLSDGANTAPAPVKRAGRPKTAEKVNPESAKYDPTKTCSKCNGMQGHSNKAHNLAEGFKDKPFTEAELKKRGFFPPQKA